MTNKNTSSFIVRCFRSLMKEIKRASRRKSKSESRRLLKGRILEYYSSQNQDDLDQDLKEAIDYVTKKDITYIPYPYVDGYDPQGVEVHFDSECKMLFVIHEGKRLYFPRKMKKGRVQNVYNYLLVEQDVRSPHCYQNGSFEIEQDDILFDVGAAEGIISLATIEIVKKIFIFEVEERWIEALNKTFEPWKEKVEIINKYVSNQDSKTTVKVDTITQQLDAGDSVFLKFDVEGAEKLVIEGAMETMTSGKFNVKAAICTYHNQKDYVELSQIMKDLNYNIERSNGYMLFLADDLQPPFFRRGLIRCTSPRK